MIGSIAAAVRSMQHLKSYRPKLQHLNIAFHSTCATISLLFLLPILSSAFVSLYIFLPLSIYFPSLYPSISTISSTTQSTLTSLPIMFASSNGQPTFFIFPAWCTGAVLLNVAYHIFCSRTTVRNPWRVQLAFFTYTFEEVSWGLALRILHLHVVWPLLYTSTMVVVFPALVAYLEITYKGWNGDIVPVEILENAWLKHYTTALLAGSAYVLFFAGQSSANTWIAKLREEEYLVEKKLRNYGEVVENLNVDELIPDLEPIE